MPSCLVAGRGMTSASTSPQLLSLLKRHGKRVQHFLTGAMCSPGTLSPHKDCLATCSPHHHRWPHCCPFPRFVIYSRFGSTPDLQHFCTGYSAFPAFAQGGFPCDCRGQNQPLGSMVTVHRQSAQTEPRAFP